jgi:hypothetical protein
MLSHSFPIRPLQRSFQDNKLINLLFLIKQIKPGERISQAPFIRLRLNTPQVAAGMKGEMNRAEAHGSEGGLIPLYDFNDGTATAQFCFDTP